MARCDKEGWDVVTEPRGRGLWFLTPALRYWWGSPASDTVSESQRDHCIHLCPKFLLSSCYVPGALGDTGIIR